MSIEEIQAQAQVNVEAAAQQARVAADAASQATRVAYDQAYYAALLDTGKGALERSRSAAELVQKAAAAVGTLYTGVLAVSFSVSGHQLPVWGLVPAIFLGLAVTLSTVYVAYLTAPPNLRLSPIPASPPDRMRVRLDNFLLIMNATASRRAYFLRAAVIALGLGVILLPSPFVSTGSATVPPAGPQYEWPSPPAPTTDRVASLDAITFKARVDEVAARRQRAEAAPQAYDLLIWVPIVFVGLLLVLALPAIAGGEETTE